MDAGKIMWVLYENPDANFDDMAMDFMDIRKRIFTFPHMGKKAYFIAVPTSSGTGSEVTPFAIITDKTTGIKWPLADYELMPDMAIVDTDNMMSAPKGLTCASGIDVMTHALEALSLIHIYIISSCRFACKEFRSFNSTLSKYSFGICSMLKFNHFIRTCEDHFVFSYDCSTADC